MSRPKQARPSGRRPLENGHKMKVVVTDYIEPTSNWEAGKLAELGVEFTPHQLKFAPFEDVVAATRDARCGGG